MQEEQARDKHKKTLSQWTKEEEKKLNKIWWEVLIEIFYIGIVWLIGFFLLYSTVIDDGSNPLQYLGELRNQLPEFQS